MPIFAAIAGTLWLVVAFLEYYCCPEHGQVAIKDREEKASE